MVPDGGQSYGLRVSRELVSPVLVGRRREFDGCVSLLGQAIGGGARGGPAGRRGRGRQDPAGPGDQPGRGRSGRPGPGRRLRGARRRGHPARAAGATCCAHWPGRPRRRNSIGCWARPAGEFARLLPELDPTVHLGRRGGVGHPTARTCPRPDHPARRAAAAAAGRRGPALGRPVHPGPGRRSWCRPCASSVCCCCSRTAPTNCTADTRCARWSPPGSGSAASSASSWAGSAATRSPRSCTRSAMHHPQRRFTDVVFERSQGNAFLVEEILAAVDSGADPATCRPSLRDVLLARTETVSEAAQRVLRTASRGRPAGRGPAAGSRGRDAGGAAVPGVAGGGRTPPARGRPAGRGYAFRHALTRDALYDDMLPGERVRLHAAYGDALCRRPDAAGRRRQRGGDAGPPLVRRAGPAPGAVRLGPGRPPGGAAVRPGRGAAPPGTGPADLAPGARRDRMRRRGLDRAQPAGRRRGAGPPGELNRALSIAGPAAGRRRGRRRPAAPGRRWWSGARSCCGRSAATEKPPGNSARHWPCCPRNR